MRHVILTCVNHPNLRWATKEIAVHNGKYNGHRTLFFMGEPVTNKDGSPKMHRDGSGLECKQIVQEGFENYRVIKECDCRADCLVVAPEDKLVKVQP